MIIILIDKNYETYRNSQTLNLPIPNCLSTLMVSQKSPKAHLSHQVSKPQIKTFIFSSFY